MLMNIKREIKIILFTLFISIIISAYFCIPLYNDILHKGSDTGFHLTRISAFREAIAIGIKYPYMWWHANFDFGYPAPLYYCQLLLFPAVYLISKGLSLIISYKIYLFLLVVSATFTIGLLQKHISKKNINAIIISTLIYIINPHQLISIFRRSALGELMAMVFIPICLLGIYYVLYDDYQKWFYLVIGYTGIVLSHNISFALMCILFFIFIIINLKTINKNRILAILKAIICVFLLTSFFTLPMLEGLTKNEMFINNQNNNTYIQGTTIKEIFNFTCDWSVSSCQSPGPFLLFIPLCGLFIKNKRKDNKFIFDTWLIGYITLFCMTKYFPWQLFKIMNFMQFASRLLPISIALLALSGAYYLNQILNKKYKYLVTILLVFLIVIFFNYPLTYTRSGMYGYSNSMTLEEAYKLLYKDGEANTYYDAQELSSADYLPINNVEYTTYEYYEPSISLSNSINDTSAYMEIDDALIDRSKYYHYIFTIDKNENDNSWISIPRTYYSGYKVKAYENGTLVKEITAHADSRNGLLQFEPLKSNIPITYDVYYEISDIQSYSMKTSIISAFLVPIYIIYDYQIKKKKAK